MKKILFSAIFALLAVPIFASAAALNVVTNTQDASYYNAVTKAADRLLSQQNSDGGWGWTGGSTSDENLTGVTALGLLDAYQLTKKQTYLNGAKIAGDKLKAITTVASTDESGHKFYASDVQFLMELARVTNDTSYSEKAKSVLLHYTSEPNRYCDSGCSAQLMADKYHAWDGKPNGFAEWSIAGWAVAAHAAGNDELGLGLASILKDDILDAAYAAATMNAADANYYSHGLTAALQAIALYPSLDDTDIKAKLLLEQDTTTHAIKSRINDGIQQATAYGVLGLLSAHDIDNARLSVDYLIGIQNSNGGWNESDGKEYTEVDSEVIQAIYGVLTPGTYYSPQAAIAAAEDGDTVSLASGTYEVTSQLDAAKSISLIGTGTVILKAAADFGTAEATKHILNITAGTEATPVTVSNITFDCDSKCYGAQSYGNIFTNFNNITLKNSKGAGLTVNGSTVNVTNVSTAGNAWGGINVDTGVGVTSTSTLVVNGTSSHTETSAIWVDDITKATSVTDANNQYSSQTYTHNTSVTGRVYGLKTVTVNSESELRAALSNSLVTTIVLDQDITLTSQLTISRALTLDGSNHTLSASFGSASVIEISANDVTIKNLVEDAHGTTGNRGINIYKVTGVLLNNVTVSNNTKNGIVVNGSTVTMNNIVTKNNGWEAIDVDLGVGVTSPANLTVTGTSVHSEVKAAIRIDDPTKDAHVIDSNNQYSITTTGTASDYRLKTINVKIATNNQLTSTGIVVDIPADTIIVGSSSWDGTIAPPTATTTTVTLSGFNTTVTSAISIGSAVSDLTFSKAVKITFAGQADKHVGWTNVAGTFAEITTACASNDQTTGDALPAGGNCKINAGADLVVWTKHFTTFSTYTQTAIPVASGGGGFVSVSNTPASNVALTATASTPNTNGQVLGEQISAQAQAKAKGKVLGVTAYNFTRNLRMGSRGDDVIELQKMLIDGGYLVLDAPTRYFGVMTKTALVKWQKEKKLPATGYFGPMSRAVALK